MTTYNQEQLDKKLEDQKKELLEKTKDFINEKSEEIAKWKAKKIALVLANEYKELSPEMKKFEDNKKMVQYYVEWWALPSDMNEQKMMMLKEFWAWMWLSLMECISWMAFINWRPAVYWSVYLWLLTKNKYKITFIKKTPEEVEVELEWPNWKQKWYFSKEMAQAAWIWKNVYLKYPTRMLSYKAIREAQNFLCPEILWWVILLEEADEYPEVKQIETEEQKEEKAEQKQKDLQEKYKNLNPNKKEDENI